MYATPVSDVEMSAFQDSHCQLWKGSRVERFDRTCKPFRG
jgi:hypothetical protein